MGWTSVRATEGVSKLKMLENHTSFYKGNKWKTSDNLLEFEVEAIAPGKGGAYAVVKQTNLVTGAVARFGYVILTETVKGQFYWKELSEFCGPVEVGMPLSMLQKLSPPEEVTNDPLQIQYSRDWRERVKAYQMRAMAIANLKVGDKFELDAALNFKVGGQEVKVSRFGVAENGRRKVFFAYPDNGGSFLCRLHRDSLNQHFRV